MKGVEALCDTLVELGVSHVFGLPGSQNAEFFGLLPEKGLRPVLATHELSAAFMACGFARASGSVAVLATIPGPGFAFALPGLAEARLDSVPILHLVGTPASGEGRFQHQAIDQAGIAAPLAKGVVEVRDPSEVRQRLIEAHTLALAGEPGPVVVHLDPGALSGEILESPPRPSEASGTERVPAQAASDELRRLVRQAKRPVLFLGGGALDAGPQVLKLVERLGAPTFTTLTARGVLPETHPCCLSFDADRGGLDELNRLLESSDLVLALGCKMSHNGTAGFRLRLPPDRLVHVNTDPAALDAGYPARLAIEGRVVDVLRRVLEDSQPGGPPWDPEEVEDLKGKIGGIRPSPLPEPRFQGVPGGSAEAFFDALRSALPDDAVLVTDSGHHQVMTRRHFEVRTAGGLMAPADLQSMGFGLPAALGASLSPHSRPVVALVGDGGFLMSAMDLLCASRETLPVVVVVFNDGQLSLIRLQQLGGYGRSSAVKIMNPDMEALAHALGVDYALVDGEPEATVRAALGTPGPTLVEVRLGDSFATHKLRASGWARNRLRGMLGERMVARIKAFLRLT